MPIRSMSLRERRHADNSQSPIPRSQSGRCEIQVGGHQHTANHHGLHQSSGRHTPSLAPSPCNRHQQLPPSPCWESSSQESGSSIHYYNPQVSISTNELLRYYVTTLNGKGRAFSLPIVWIIRFCLRFGKCNLLRPTCVTSSLSIR